MNSTNFYGTTTSDNITFTTSSAGDFTSTINLNDSNSMWFPSYPESTWIPYDVPPYKPKWHIKLGYKIQLSKMWGD